MKAAELKSQPPMSLPVLTEVVALPVVDGLVVEALVDSAPSQAVARAPTHDASSNEDGFAPTQPVPLDAPEEPGAIDQHQLIERVLGDLNTQVELMLEHRLRETLAPVLARMTDTLVREMRNQLASSLREMVVKAVEIELDRHHKQR